MFATADTIVAIATPPGRGGIGVVRISGPSAQAIARELISATAPLEPRRATFTRVRSKAAGAIDQAVVTLFPAPASYTGDDVVELSAHGSPVVLKAIVEGALAAGARLAEPGEFTLRAYLNGRIDLTQAEAVADLIESVTPLQARAAFDQLQGTLTDAIGEIDRQLFDLIARLEASVDFPDEGFHFVEPEALADALDGLIASAAALLAGAKRGRLVREGLSVAIVGRPNVGKSSLFNALVGSARAIVTDVPGTTRDLVSETVDLNGLRVTLIDTAGLRETPEAVEAEGVSRAMRALEMANLVLVVEDGSRPMAESEVESILKTTDNKRVIVTSKSDLGPLWQRPDAVLVSATEKTGLDALRRRIVEALGLEVKPLADPPEITNVRHIALVERAHDALVRTRDAAVEGDGSMPEEFVLADLQDARAALEEITGRRAPEDVLAHIFERFCVGK
jgi:tRNA modification GTPase